MPETTRLYRSHNYPYKLNETVELEKYIDTESGTYLLTALDIDGNFKLEIPTDQGKHEIIYDTFNEFQDRDVLYKRLDKGVFQFIQESMLEFQTLNVKEKPAGTEIVVTMNNDRYVLTVVESTGICTMKYPERETKPFYIDNIFIENPELPLIKDGRLIGYLKEQVKKKLTVDLPQVPYFPMLSVIPKN